MCLSHTLHFGSAPFSNMFAWKFLVGRVWSCAAMMKPSVSDLRPEEASHWWVSEEFTSGSLARIGYLPWRSLSFHPSFSSLIFLIFYLCLNLFCFFRRWRIFINVVSAKVNLIEIFFRIASNTRHTFILLVFFTSLSIQSFVLLK